MIDTLEAVDRPNIGFQADMAHTLLYLLGYNSPRDRILPEDFAWTDRETLEEGLKTALRQVCEAAHVELPQSAPVATRGYASCELLEGQHADRRDDDGQIVAAFPVIELHHFVFRAPRKTLVELLMTDHVSPCARERQSGDCELEALAKQDNLARSCGAAARNSAAALTRVGFFRADPGPKVASVSRTCIVMNLPHRELVDNFYRLMIR